MSCSTVVINNCTGYVVRTYTYWPQLEELREWCVNTLGDNSPSWREDDLSKARWMSEYQMFWFKSERDRVLFLLANSHILS